MMPERYRGQMLGLGGRVIEPRSESAELDEIFADLVALMSRFSIVTHAQERRLVAETMMRVRRLRDQVAAGYHANPGLRAGGGFTAGRVIGQIAEDVHDLRYTHHDDKENYEHRFAGSVTLWAVRRGNRNDVLLTHRDGQPLWEDI